MPLTGASRGCATPGAIGIASAAMPLAGSLKVAMPPAQAGVNAKFARANEKIGKERLIRQQDNARRRAEEGPFRVGKRRQWTQRFGREGTSRLLRLPTRPPRGSRRRRSG